MGDTYLLKTWRFCKTVFWKGKNDLAARNTATWQPKLSTHPKNWDPHASPPGSSAPFKTTRVTHYLSPTRLRQSKGEGWRSTT